MQMNFILSLFMLLMSPGMAGAEAVSADSLLRAERLQYYTKYRTLKDTITVNTWVNMKRMNDNLEKIVEIDNLLIDSLRMIHDQDSLLLAGQQMANQRFSELTVEYDRLKARTENDLNMLLYLKTAAGVLVAAIVLLVFFMIDRNSRMRKSVEQAEHYEALFEEKRMESEALQAELDRMKKREMEFRDELEKGMQLNTERLKGLQEKCNRLEEEKRRLEQSVQRLPESMPDPGGEIALPPIPEDAAEMAQMIRTLSEERNSLINLAAQLQKKTEDERARRLALLEQIDKLARNLSQIGDSE
jgi:hypothetical protein